MSSGSSQQGFVLSLGLHVSVVAVVAVLAWTKPFERKHENIFELIPLGTPGPASEGDAPEVDFNLPDGPKTPPTPTATPPRPRPAPPRPTPTATPPAPRPQVTPAPRSNTPKPPAPTPAPPDRVSYEDFVQQHGKPQARPPRTTAPPRARTAPRIDTRFSSTVSGTNRASGSVTGSPDADRTEVTLYLANLYDAIKRAWEKPGTEELSVAVDFDIAPNGRISNIRISRSSGDAAYDQSALAAVRTVGSIGPTPGGQALLRTLNFKMEPE